MSKSGIRAQLLNFSICTACICCSTSLPRAAGFQLSHDGGSILLSNTIVIDTGVSDSLTEAQRNWLRVLALPAPSIGQGSMTFDHLIAELGGLGLPVVLDASASDQGLELDEVVELPFQNQPLIDRLSNAFAAYDLTITMDSGQLRILSIDVSEDPEFNLLVTYDLTGVANVDSFVEASEIIDPDGDLLESGSMAVFKLNGRDLMSVNMPFAVHLKLRRFFHSVAVHTGPITDGSYSPRIRPMIPSTGGNRMASVVPSNRQLSSSPVALPAKKIKAGINLTRDGSGSGFGGAMGGMGGGAF